MDVFLGAVDLQHIHPFIHDWWFLKKQTIFNPSPLHPTLHINPAKASVLYDLLLTGEYWGDLFYQTLTRATGVCENMRDHLFDLNVKIWSERSVESCVDCKLMSKDGDDDRKGPVTVLLSPGSRHEPPPAHIHPGQVRASRCNPTWCLCFGTHPGIKMQCPQIS